MIWILCASIFNLRCCCRLPELLGLISHPSLATKLSLETLYLSILLIFRAEYTYKFRLQALYFGLEALNIFRSLGTAITLCLVLLFTANRRMRTIYSISDAVRATRFLSVALDPASVA